VETVAKRMHFMKMAGQEVFKHAVANMARTAQQVLDESALSIRDIRYIIPHQANARIIKAVGQRLGAREDQMYVNVDKYGNTSAASVILALDEASKSGVLARGDKLMIVVFGAGFTWGAMILEWGP
jgi:3-oxoacyl-[acyl-carrier-protein] synthase-3